VRAATDRDTIEALVADLAISGPGELPKNQGLWDRLTGAEEEKPVLGPGERLLDDKLGNPLREILWKRALLGATVAHAAVGAVQLEEKINRSARAEQPQEGS